MKNFLAFKESLLAAFIFLGIATACTENVKPTPDPSPKEEPTDTLTTSAPEAPYVVLVSFDGFRYDYAEKHGAENLQQLGRENVKAAGLRPSFPTNTFPNHYSIVTGMYPQNHRLVNNSFYDWGRETFYSMGDANKVRDAYYYNGTPLWVLAEQQEMKSACYFWVGSEADIQEVRPSYYYNYDGGVPNDKRIDKVIEWLQLPEDERPHFITLYFSDTDKAGHSYGPDAPQTYEAVQEIDRLVGRMNEEFAELDLPINLILVSDHGMLQVNNKELIDLSNIIDFNPFKIAFGSNMIMFYNDDQSTIDEAYQQLKAAENNFTVYLKDEMPDSLHFSDDERIGDLIALSNPPFVFGRERTTTSPGKHGFNPYQVEEMNGIFYAKGPAFEKAQELEVVDNIHIYPLIAEILGLEYDENAIDGKLEAIEEVLIKE